MRTLTILMMLLGAGGLAVNAQESSPQTAQTLTNDDVIKMSRSGLNEGLVLDLIREKPSQYATDPRHLIELKKSGVSETLVNEMVRKTPVPDPLNTENIIALSRAGYGSGFLVNLIHYQLGGYSTNAGELKQAGLSDDVIAAMSEKPGASQPALAPRAAAAAATPATPPPVAGQRVELPAGTFIPVRLIDSIDSKRNGPGDTFRATLAEDLRLGNEIVVRRGAEATVRLAGEKDANRIVGRTVLTLELVSLTVGDRKVTVVTDTVVRESESRTAQTAKRSAIMGGAGAILGAILGGGKGAAIGAGAGAGTGAGTEALKKAPGVHVPSESVLTFRTSGPTIIENRPSTQ